MAKKAFQEFKNLQRNSLLDELIGYIEIQLPKFPHSQEFVDILKLKKNENQHSLAFCAFMTNECGSKFYFGRENAQNGRSVIDIGVYKGSVLLFTIEAKLLPIPLTYSDRNEYEYVYGPGGGIQRFKENNHGVDNENNLLNENGIIAYILKDEFSTWQRLINKWILDAKWGREEQLEKVYFNTTGRLKSIHLRSTNTIVTLHHFWVKVYDAKN